MAFCTKKKTAFSVCLLFYRGLIVISVAVSSKHQFMTKKKKIQKQKQNEDYQINAVDYYFQIEHMGQHQNEGYLLCD